MNKHFLQIIFLLCFSLLTLQGNTQVSLTATAGTANGSFSTIKDAFDAINAGTHQGSIAITLTGNTSESASAVLNASGSGSASYSSISVQPSGGAARTISGSIAGVLIDLNGADNVIFNGLNSGGNSLTIENSNSGTTAATIRFINDATANLIQKCTIKGSSTAVTTATIVFSTASSGGNDYNFINLCTIQESGSNLPVNAIYSAGSASNENSGNNILNNNIQNFFSASLVSTGILVSTNNTDWVINSNKFYQTASRAYTTANTHSVINIASGNEHEIANNSIGYATSSSTGTYTMTSSVATRFIAINLAVGTTTATSVFGNTIASISLTTSSGAATQNGVLCGINVTAGNVYIGTSGGNTIGATSGTGSLSATPSTTQGAVVGIAISSTGTIVIQNNTFGAMQSTSGTATIAGAVFGVYLNAASTSVTISGNTIGNSTANNMLGGINGTTTGSSLVAGVHIATYANSLTITNNTIQNLTSYGTATAGYVKGIGSGTTGSTSSVCTFSNNSIHDLTTSAATAGLTSGLCSASGITLFGATGSSISGNTIYNIANLNTAATTNIYVAGITLAGSPSVTTVHHINGNRIYGLSNSSASTTATAPPVAAGIAIRSGGTGTTFKIYNNMIALGNSISANTSFVGIIGNHGSTPNPTADSIQYNTINIEGSVSSGSNHSACVLRGDFSTTSRAIVTDVRNNLLTNSRSGGSGKHYAIGNNIGNSTSTATGWTGNYNILNANSSTIGYWSGDNDFSNWKTNSSGDNNSYSGVSVTYQNSANDLHINMGSTPNAIESNAITIGDVSSDFDGQSRPGGGGTSNGGGGAHDIGADEFDGALGTDVTAPSISYSNISNTSSTSNLSLSSFATITDGGSGVNTTSGTRPRIYYKKSTDNNTFGANNSSTNGWKYAEASNTSSPFSFTIDYSIINGGSVTGGDVVQYFVIAQDLATTPNVASSPSSGLSATSVSSISSAPSSPNSYIIVGAPLSGNYNVGSGGSYTTITAAVADLTLRGVSGAVTFTLTDNSYSGSETFPITIGPVVGASSSNTVTIKPASATAVTVSGSPATLSAIFKLSNARYIILDGLNTGGSSLTITNSTASAGSAGVWISSAGAGQGSAQNAIKNCTVSCSSDQSTGTVVSYGIVIAGPTLATTIASVTAGNDNDSNTIMGNTILKCRYGIVSRGGATTNANEFNNYQGNTIGPASFGSDEIGKGGIIIREETNGSITQNEIRFVGGAFANTTSGSDRVGIGFATDAIWPVTTGVFVTNFNVQRNLIHDIVDERTFAAVGVAIGGVDGANNTSNTIANNSIYGIKANGTSTDQAIGIGASQGKGDRIVFNSIYMFGDCDPNASASTPTQSNYGISISSTTPSNLTILNNAVYMDLSSSSASSIQNACINIPASYSWGSGQSDYNGFYFLSSNTQSNTGCVGGTGGGFENLLSDWQTTSSMDGNSTDGDPLFGSITDLTPSSGSSLLGAGVGGTGITVDILGATRNATPSIGAYENAGDNSDPSISYTTISNTSSTSNMSLSSFATITDPGSGVNTTSGTRPRIYYKKSTDNNTFGANNSSTNGWKYAEASNTSSPFSFTIDYSIINGGSVAGGDVIQYFVTAQDLASSINVGANPSAGFNATSVSSISSAPTTPNSYIIVGSPLSGAYNVGTSGAYTTITAAVADAVLRGVSGAVTFNLTNSSYTSGETFPIVITEINGTSASNTVTIKPAASNTVSISASATSLFKLNGADYVIFDGSNNGSSSQDMTITNTNATTATGVFWLASATASDGATNNTIKNCIIRGASITTTFAGVFMGGTSSIAIATTALTANSSNTFSNNNVATTMHGIVTSGLSTNLDNGLTISNNQVGTSSLPIGGVGVAVYFASSPTVSNNQIENIVGGSSLAAITGSVSLHAGLYIRNCTSAIVNANNIHNISCNGTGSPRTVGLATESPSFNTSGSPSANRFSNNLIYDVYNQATGSTSWTCTGLGTYGGYGDMIYYNTVQLSHPTGGSITNSNGPFAVFANGHAVMTATTTNVDVRNNVFIASGATATTSTGHAHYTQLTSYSGATVSNNRYYLNVTGNTNNYMGRFNAVNYSTLSSWQSATSVDGSSSEGDPQLNSLTNHVPITGSPLVSAGTPVSVTTDYAGTTRHASTPTIGAYETAADASAPSISYTPLGSTSSTANRTASNFATITDLGAGVDGTSGTRPRIYYKKSSDADAFGANNSSTNGWKYVEASNSSSPFSFTIDYSIINGGSVTQGDSIEYFVVAQDLATTPNISANPLTGFAGTTVSSISSAPTTPEYYVIAAALSTSLSVGTSQTYTSLTGASGLFNAINTGVLGGNTTVSITSDLSEDGTVALENAGLGGYTLTIQPSAAATRVISNSAALGQAMIRFDGTAGVTIDGRSGGSGQYLRIVNTHTTAASCQPAIEFLNSCSTNTLRNCIIETNASTATLGSILLGTGSNYEIIIRNNDIRDAQGTPGTAGSPSACVYSNNASNQATLMNNSLYNFTTNGIRFTAVADSCIISDNSFYNNLSTPPSVAQTSILVQGGSGNHTISGNYIGGSAANCGGSAWVNSGAVTFVGILLTGSSNASSLQGNTVQNINLTGTAGVNFNGIQVTGGNANVGTTSGNTIGHNTTANSIQSAGSSATSVTAGILSTTTGTLVIANNTIANMTSTGTTTSVGLRGISHIATSALTVTGNTIHSLTSACITVSFTTSACIGVYISSANTAHSVSENTIYNLSNSAASANTSVIGIGLNLAASGGTVSRNRIYDLRNVSTGSPNLIGIAMNTGTSWSIQNNQITITNGSNTNNSNIFGIRDASAGSHTYYYNSVYIGGNATAGTLNSYCMIRTTTTSTPIVRNNIFYNGRTASSGGTHYASGSSSATGITANTQNYNLMVVNDSAKIVEIPTGVSNGWYAFGTIYTAVQNSGLVALVSNVAAANLFSDISNGNLNIKTNNADCWHVNGKGVQLSGITEDYSSSSAGRSTTVAGGGTDIGSDEFTPGSNSPNMSVSGSHTANGTETFTFAGRRIATITWGSSGTLPTLSTYRHWTGTWPNDPTNNGSTSGASYLNSYLSITASGGSGYTYSLTMYYDPALLGTVSSESKLRMTKKQTGTDGTWHIQSYSLDSTANSITALGQTGFSEFTGTDEDNLLPSNDAIGNNTVLSNQNVCINTSPSSLSGSFPTGGNGSYTYEWLSSTTSATTGFTSAAGTNNLQSYSPGSLSTTTWYRRLVTSGSMSDSSTAVEMTVVSYVTPSVSMVASDDSICSGASTTYTATPTFGGSSPTYNFFVNGSSVQNSTSNNYTTSSIANGDSVWVVMTADNLCQTTSTATSSKIYMVVNSIVTPSVTITPNSGGLCGNTSITYTATPTYGGSSPTYNFKVGSTSMQNGSSNSYTASLSAGSVVTCEMTSSYSCVTTSFATSNSLTVVTCPSSSSFVNPNVWSASSSGSTGSTNVVINTTPVTVSSSVQSNNLTINAGDTLIINSGGNLTINGDLTVNGVLIMNSGSISFTKPGVRIPTGTYHQLRACASGTVFLGGNITVNNNLIICSGTTLNDSGYVCSVKGNVNNDGTHTSIGSGKILLNGTVSQTLDNAGSYTSPYGNLEVTSSLPARVGNSTSTNKHVTINGALTLTSGGLNINGNTLTFGNTGNMAASGTGVIQTAVAGASVVINGNGASAQLAGLACNMKGSLTLNRPAGAKLNGTSIIGSTLTLTSGRLDLNGFNLTIGSTTSSTGSISSGSGSLHNSNSSAGTLTIAGNASAAAITGVKADSLYRLNVSLPNGISLGSDVFVHSLVTMSAGTCDLNGKVVTLSSTASISESAGKLFTGNTGYITTSRGLSSAPSAMNIAGMGLVFTHSTTPGFTTLTRGHTVQTSGSGSSIKRYYQLQVTNGGTSAIQLNYQSSELNGATHSRLRMNSSTNGGSSWATHSGVTRSTAATTAWVQKSGISLSTSATLFTLSDSTASPLSPVFVASTSNFQLAASSSISAFPNPFADQLTLSIENVEAESSVLKVFDISGKLLINQAVKLGKGLNQVRLATNQLAAGIYLVQVGNSTLKVVKE